jgi:hypothetical protein
MLFSASRELNAGGRTQAGRCRTMRMQPCEPWQPRFLKRHMRRMNIRLLLRTIRWLVRQFPRPNTKPKRPELYQISESIYESVGGLI